MNASHLLCTDLLPTYTEFKSYSGKEFTGYKLAVRKGGPNYYSIVTGLFRYKASVIGPKSYSNLYKQEKKHYNEHLSDRVSVFTNKEDAKNALFGYKDIDTHNGTLVLIQMTLSMGLEKAKYTNKNVTELDVVVGKRMEDIIELEVLYDKDKK